MRHGSHEHPVRPKNAGRKAPFIGRVRRRPISFTGGASDAILALIPARGRRVNVPAKSELISELLQELSSNV